MSWSRNKNNIPVNPSFLYIMWCLEGCSSHGLVNMMIELLVHENTISSFSMCSVPYKCYTNLVKTYVAELTSAGGCVEL